jgi:SNF2-related domain
MPTIRRFASYTTGYEYTVLATSQTNLAMPEQIPENALSKPTYKTQAKFLHWEAPSTNLSVKVPPPNMRFVSQEKPFHEMINQLTPAASVPPVLCEVDGLSNGAVNSLVEYCETKEHEQVVLIDLFWKSCTRNARRLSIIVAPSLLKFAAENKLPLTLSKWYTLPTSESWGRCKQHVPPRPVEKWQKRTDRDGAMERVYDPEESNEYYHLLLNRPRAFHVAVDKSKLKLMVSMDPRVVAHQAAAQLGGEKSASLDVEYSLSEVSSMGEPSTKDFHVPNSDQFAEAHMDGLELPLYPRQAKALSRMMAIENGDVLFSEEERSEVVLPGVGWCLIARARKHTPLRGGVLGDAIGSGKTAVTIAFILAKVEEARKNQDTVAKRSGATLVVVPPGLVQQWDDERRVRMTCEQSLLANTLTLPLPDRNSPRTNSSASLLTVPAPSRNSLLKIFARLTL